ncbi:hypothetical protein BDF21DRAFT_431260 [Thamnidium elegans]|uniref:Uncharacterized protein n=1 Tax=Thamnidium elegans TaxID=101142 RepID=A0A8H7SL06_9FUNG|nr:hypothetical protein INT48_000596 [Thamnidium elegans]KAI8054882.1 hypothetical protein BDF21DRAFT_431260 [Thamnidium elegans]
MAFIVSSKPSPMLLSSQKEVINRSDNSVVINSDSLLLNHYSKTIPYIERDDIKLPSLYRHDNNQKEGSIEGGSAVEEEDTEDEDDDEDMLSSVTTLSEAQEQKVCATTTSAARLCTGQSCLIKKAPLSSSLPPIQTYSPQLNLSLYSPSITTPVSSIRSKKNRAYPTSSLSTTFASAAAASAAVPPPSSCFKDTSTVQNPTNISSFINKPLYSTTQVSSSIASTLKMDIRSPPQPSQSTSRFMNAFQRLRGGSINHRNQNANTNSVAPAEICNVKPLPTKSSLADKIKNKFQQLDKKKRASLQETIGRKNSILNNKRSVVVEKAAIPRSTSLSSISNWPSRRLTANNKSNDTILPKGKMTHSGSMTSFLSSKTNHSVSSSLSSSSSTSSASSSSSSQSKSNPPAFTLTKSISSHRIYKNTSSTVSENRPRQPLRATNPSDSVRFSLRHGKQKKTQVRFTKLVSVRETYSKVDYDRGSDPDAVCTRLTPSMAQQIKEELNAYKLHEMQVHEFSRVHTHFFL